MGSYPLTGIALTGLSTVTIGYSGCVGNEIMLYQISTKRVLYFDKATGAYSTFTQLPLTAPTPYIGYSVSFTDNRVWINATGSSGAWNSYIIAGTSSLTLSAPNGAECWVAGTTRAISWSSSGVSNVNIEVSSDGGSTWASVASNVAAAGGSYNWAIPTGQAPGSNYRIKVSDASNASLNDISNADFTISAQPTMSIRLSPTLLWPANRSLATVNAAVSVSGGCSPAYTLLSITSSEPESGTETGDVADDIQGEAIGTDDVQFQLRAERRTSGNGRVYTVTYRFTDAGGFTQDVSERAVVPYNMGGMTPGGANACGAAIGSSTSGGGTVDIPYSLATASTVTLSVYDSRGKEIHRLVYNAAIAAGSYSVTWNGTNSLGLNPGTAQPAGTYIVVMRACSSTVVRAIQLVRP